MQSSEAFSSEAMREGRGFRNLLTVGSDGYPEGERRWRTPGWWRVLDATPGFIALDPQRKLPRA
ncbi:MAG: hypothetical protein COC14_10980 [Burkholderiaceae bacterium]|nr:MAG: hypothetical protein COC14_10980 [Burkholderiaceae bacterium]